MSKIFVDQKVIDIDALTIEDKQSALKTLHGRQDIVCVCNKTAQLLVKQSSRGKFYISRKSNEGHLHEIGCKVFISASISGEQCYEDGVVKELYDGGVRINLGIKLNQHEKSSLFQEYSESNIANYTGESIRAQPAMSLLGLLHYLWERSGLNSTTTYPSTTKRMYEKLRDEASYVHIQKSTLEDMLLTGTVGQAENNSEYNLSALQLKYRNKEIFQNNKKKKKSMFIIAEISEKTTEKFLVFKHPVDTEGLNEIPFVQNVSISEPSLWEKACIRFPLAKKELLDNSNGTRVFVIARIDAYESKGELLFNKNKKNTYYQVADLAMMPVAIGMRGGSRARWRIPFDSSHEKEVALKLMSEERCFIKPLRYDAHRDIVFPDFILTDTKTKVPIEVWGIVNNDEYIKRKCEKTKYYEEVFCGSWWEWDVYQKDIPEFPAKVFDCLK